MLTHILHTTAMHPRFPTPAVLRFRSAKCGADLGCCATSMGVLIGTLNHGLNDLWFPPLPPPTRSPPSSSRVSPMRSLSRSRPPSLSLSPALFIPLAFLLAAPLLPIPCIASCFVDSPSPPGPSRCSNLDC
eukprot:2816330-Rhodomonas_salina.3